MTMMNVDVDQARPARSADTRAAINYLLASGAVAIGITEFAGVASFRAGNPFAVVVFWIAATEAKPVVKLARKLAGPAPGIATAMASLHEAAASRRADVDAGHRIGRPGSKRRP